MRLKIRKPLFSIITVVNNDLSGLVKTVDSISKQTFGDYQHIIKSTLHTSKVCKYLDSLKDSRLVVKKSHDLGIYDAMNQALTLVRGSYVIFLNTGDVFCNNMVLQSVSSLIDEAAVVYGDTIDNEGRLYKASPINKWRKMGFCHQSVFVRADLYARGFNLNFSICADRHFFASHAEDLPIKKLNTIIAIIERTGFSSQKPIRTINEINQINRNHLNELYVVGLCRLIYHQFRQLVKSVLGNFVND
jgi:glycosyltransferase involved in cell wall biosynthesis